jgi:hypothetical protein
MTLKDSGERQEFETGAVRDIAEGKGRCDLLPLDVVAEVTENIIIDCIGNYTTTGNVCHLVKAIHLFTEARYGDLSTALLEVSKHYEDGCKKYGERNWEKGIPLHCYIDSAVRHYLKYIRGDTDEPHDRAFLWNLLCAIWTNDHYPELCDLPFGKK